ncbi:MAG: thioredoxin [Chlamydiae bacterium]|nr:thioredoxin [Chlamydiota bacterium]
MAQQEVIQHLSKDNFSSEIQKGVVLVDFYADWCGPCRMLAPVLTQVAEEMQGKATIAKLDIEEAEQITQQLQITSVPTLILFKNGKEYKRISGLRDVDYLRDFLNAALA